MPRLKTFLCFHFPSERFVRRVAYHLKRQPDIELLFFPYSPPPWHPEIEEALKRCDRFVIFLDAELGDTQRREIECVIGRLKASAGAIVANIVYVKLPGAGEVLTLWGEPIPVNKPYIAGPSSEQEIDDERAALCAKEVTNRLFPPDYATPSHWVAADGLPVGYPFGYEKVIIEEYVKGGGRLRECAAVAVSNEHDGDKKKKTCGDLFEEGCPERWPELGKMQPGDNPAYTNPIPPEEIGSFRKETDQIIVDVRTQYHRRNHTCQDTDQIQPGTEPHEPGRKEREACCLLERSVAFLEAGPRQDLIYPRRSDQLTVAVLVSGGIAPGINAVIAGIVERHRLYQSKQAETAKTDDESWRPYTLKIVGYRDGFTGLLRLSGDNDIPLGQEAREHANHGGSILGTSRYDPLLDMQDPKNRDQKLQKMIRNLGTAGVDILYIIGGDGSMRAAHAIWTRAQEMYKDGAIGHKLSVVAVPKTMDNDVLWVWQSFGFMSAVDKAKEFMQQLHTEVHSNPRVCVIQLFGSDSGFVVTHAALASGVCDAVLIPEVDFTLKSLCKHVKARLTDRRKSGSPYAIVAVAETAVPQSTDESNCYEDTGIPVDLHEIIEDPYIGLEEKEKEAIRYFILHDRRVQGQTPDALRSGSLKIISRVLQREIKKMLPREVWEHFHVFTNEPRHLLRAIDPSSQDVIFAHRLGTLAVDNAMAGYTDFMISQWLTEYVLVPLPLVVLGRKRVSKNGIFWKTVLATTGQPPDMV